MKIGENLRKILSLCGVFCIASVWAVSGFCAQNPNNVRAAIIPQVRDGGAVRSTSRSATAPTASVAARSATGQVSARSATAAITGPRESSAAISTSRSASIGTRVAATRQTKSVAPAAMPSVTARAAIVPTGASMNGDYNTCRDSYFTCMDQFCANRDETYRRCACSSRLDALREMERKVAQTKTSLENFADYNIDAVSKTAQEVAASLSATVGESSIAKDKSASAQMLAGISSVLGNTKSQSLSTAGKLDIAGDISSIWSTPDFIGGADIANLEGEALYSQVHGQCMEMVMSACPREATLNMVVSAYGMYIEQDCNTIAAAVEGKKTTAAAAIRQTEREMDLARLQNYNAHNSTAINECIAQVRKDITSDGACGKDYVHCLDVTGLYLDYNTGEPIYTVDFFKLEGMLTLDGDFLNSNQNRLLVRLLEEKKSAATRGLDTCQDLANDVWQEFKRQAVVEIYQAQQARIRQVRDECLSVVNQCYDEKIGQLKNFANIDGQMIIGQSVGTAEALCTDKMNACSNVFGGSRDGLAQLLAFVTEMGSAKISENCYDSLNSYIREVCATTNDLNHAYPYSCRVRNPGSYDCERNGSCDTQAGSVYELLSKYARENCARTDYSRDSLLPENRETP